jgi:hypothetical protein
MTTGHVSVAITELIRIRRLRNMNSAGNLFISCMHIRNVERVSRRVVIFFTLFLCFMSLSRSYAQDDEEVTEQGHPIGKISTQGNLIVLELDDGALGQAHLFDLVGRTLRFTPYGSRYRVDNGPLQWDADFGSALVGSELTLHQFEFPFSGQLWKSLNVGTTGSIRLGTQQPDSSAPFDARDDGGVTIGRFDQLTEAAAKIIDSTPAICVFLKPRMSGPHFAKELADRVVITWDVTEPFGNIQDFTWFKTVNRFQAVLHRDGIIEMSYKELAAKDAIVGVYPVLAGSETTLAAFSVEPHPTVAVHLDIQKVRVSVVDNVLLKVTLETRGPVIPEGNPSLEGIEYRVLFDAHQPAARADAAQTTFAWTVRGLAKYVRTPRYVASGLGVSRKVKIIGNRIIIQGALPEKFKGIEQAAVSAEAIAPGNPKPTDRLLPHLVRLAGIGTPEVHFSSMTRNDGSFALAYESFHYLKLPRPQDLSCSVIKRLGDKFDFLAYYSDFRIDNQEAGTPSDGPVGGNVTGIGQEQHDLASYCTQGRFQWGYVQPVYVGSNQMQERPPEGAPIGTDHDITFYTHLLKESSADGNVPPYNYAMSQLGHEMGHRWAAFLSAKVNGEIITLGPVHWARGLQAPVAFPYQRPVEASAMGGGVWQDNFDGTYTQLDDDYYVPATGYSYLDLYLMGLISAAEVPDFFILKNLVSVGKDANGHPIFNAERTKVTIQDVIAAAGPRIPDVDHSQRNFNTGIVVVVEHGHLPTPGLVERADGIRKQWIRYYETTTGHRASMTTNPR